MKGNELKPRIGIFGRRNYGKSSLINYITAQNIAIVSDVPGSTTDPVRKTMEIAGIGPVVFIDTAGIDEDSDLGILRVDKTYDALSQSDLAIILITNNSFADPEQKLLALCRQLNTPYVILYTQSDKFPPEQSFLDYLFRETGVKPLAISVKTDNCRELLYDAIRQSLPKSSYQFASLLGNYVSAGDHVVLVTPIDSSAPEGRMILSQVQVIRDLLDNHVSVHICRESELNDTLLALNTPPRMVITDSQVFSLVSPIVPPDVELTSFSIVLAHAKGPFNLYLEGTPTLDSLNEHSRLLLLESCTHNVTCEDIGRVKLPQLIQQHLNCTIPFDVVAGLSQPPLPWNSYSLVIQCGGCVVSQKQLFAHLLPAIQSGIPVTNYGLALAYLNGIFHRATHFLNNSN